MKLRNKKTGEIGLIHCDATMYSNKIGVFIDNNHIDLCNPYKIYTSLAELNAEWEDYEKPEGWCVTMYGGISRTTKDDEPLIPDLEEIGNYFNDKESAYDALDKLKAWKRLKDKGFRFNSCKIEMSEIIVPEITITAFIYTEEPETLNLVNLLFGGEK